MSQANQDGPDFCCPVLGCWLKVSEWSPEGVPRSGTVHQAGGQAGTAAAIHEHHGLAGVGCLLGLSWFAWDI